MDTICRRCGADQRQDLVEISWASERGPRYTPGRWDPCTGCGFTGEPMDRPVPHRYVPPLAYARGIVRWSPADDIAPQVLADVGYSYVYCGPPATLPAVPTPEEILTGAGLPIPPWWK